MYIYIYICMCYISAFFEGAHQAKWKWQHPFILHLIILHLIILHLIIFCHMNIMYYTCVPHTYTHTHTPWLGLCSLLSCAIVLGRAPEGGLLLGACLGTCILAGVGVGGNWKTALFVSDACNLPICPPCDASTLLSSLSLACPPPPACALASTGCWNDAWVGVLASWCAALASRDTSSIANLPLRARLLIDDPCFTYSRQWVCCHVL